METIEHSLNGNPGLGRRSSLTITRNGDLIGPMYLQATLAAMTVSEDAGSRAAWVRRVGHALIAEVEVEIGGSRIDRQFGEWLHIWYELARKAGDGERGFDKMIGDVPELTAYNGVNKPEYTLYIPLQFWFNRHYGLALPLIALQYHEVRINIDFADRKNLVVANDAFTANGDMKCVELQDAQLLVDYIYLDSEERRRFAQVGHEYLIEQVQFTGEESATDASRKYRLDFNHPTKELIWAVKNGNYYTGKKFLAYTHLNDWSCVLEEAACKILLDSVALLSGAVCDVDAYGNPVVVSSGEEPPAEGSWEAFGPGEKGHTANGKVYVQNDCEDKCLWINTSSLKIGSYNLTDKISADILVDADCNVKCTNVCTDLTVRDLSFPVSAMNDTRYTTDNDVIVHQPFNFGLLIDGSGNPIDSALIQLNGHDRFDERAGEYFNYVQPHQHHTNTPADGICVYSFAIHPEQHQPSGSANLSRIDNTQLSLKFSDETHLAGLPALDFLNADNELYVYALSYNVLRIMSGMGGLAYSN